MNAAKIICSAVDIWRVKTVRKGGIVWNARRVGKIPIRSIRRIVCKEPIVIAPIAVGDRQGSHISVILLQSARLSLIDHADRVIALVKA